MLKVFTEPVKEEPTFYLRLEQEGSGVKVIVCDRTGKYVDSIVRIGIEGIHRYRNYSYSVIATDHEGRFIDITNA